MHPQDEKTDKDVSPQTGKGRPDERDAAAQANAQESAQRRDRQNDVGSDNQPQQQRGTNLDKF
ncbi:hypothetical protein [Pulveribacter suum]|uniref:Uncharacterized protein n=1 Tax=Pulveribacter suum TaxID=2116657 RepID=A0A2P1NHJ6_9BURK|nr:hypothetical protein [Pulveribacter suum]AVP56521.1 hypothetical protein C7H73_01735 [Pulveribacter suum]